MSDTTMQELRDRLAEQLWDNRRLVSQWIDDTNQIINLQLENDALKAKLAAAQKWQPSLEIGHGQWPLSQAMRDDVGGPEEDAAWAYLNDEQLLRQTGANE